MSNEKHPIDMSEMVSVQKPKALVYVSDAISFFSQFTADTAEKQLNEFLIACQGLPGKVYHDPKDPRYINVMHARAMLEALREVERYIHDQPEGMVDVPVLILRASDRWKFPETKE